MGLIVPNRGNVLAQRGKARCCPQQHQRKCRKSESAPCKNTNRSHKAETECPTQVGFLIRPGRLLLYKECKNCVTCSGYRFQEAKPYPSHTRRRREISVQWHMLPNPLAQVPETRGCQDNRNRSPQASICFPEPAADCWQREQLYSPRPVNLQPAREGRLSKDDGSELRILADLPAACGRFQKMRRPDPCW